MTTTTKRRFIMAAGYGWAQAFADAQQWPSGTWEHIVTPTPLRDKEVNQLNAEVYKTDSARFMQQEAAIERAAAMKGLTVHPSPQVLAQRGQMCLQPHGMPCLASILVMAYGQAPCSKCAKAVKERLGDFRAYTVGERRAPTGSPAPGAWMYAVSGLYWPLPWNARESQAREPVGLAHEAYTTLRDLRRRHPAIELEYVDKMPMSIEDAAKLICQHVEQRSDIEQGMAERVRTALRRIMRLQDTGAEPGKCEHVWKPTGDRQEMRCEKCGWICPF